MTRLNKVWRWLYGLTMRATAPEGYKWDGFKRDYVYYCRICGQTGCTIEPLAPMPVCEGTERITL